MGRASGPDRFQPVKLNNHYEPEPEPEPEAAALIARIADLVIAGTSARQVAATLNQDGTPTVRRGQRWDSAVILRILRNPSLRGYVMHDDEVVRGEDGLPVQRTPILDDRASAQVQAGLDKNGSPGSGIRKGASPLLGIVHCAECGQRLYIKRRAEGDRYRHRDGSTCFGGSYTARDVERQTIRHLLVHTDELPMMERQEIPAEDHLAELQRVQESLDQLDQAFERGTVSAESYGRMTARLEAKRDHLASLPVTEAEERWEPTGESFHDHWRSLDAAGQHDLLLALGVGWTSPRRPRESWCPIPRSGRAFPTAPAPPVSAAPSSRLTSARSPTCANVPNQRGPHRRGLPQFRHWPQPGTLQSRQDSPS